MRTPSFTTCLATRRPPCHHCSTMKNTLLAIAAAFLAIAHTASAISEKDFTAGTHDTREAVAAIVDESAAVEKVAAQIHDKETADKLAVEYGRAMFRVAVAIQSMYKAINSDCLMLASKAKGKEEQNEIGEKLGKLVETQIAQVPHKEGERLKENAFYGSEALTKIAEMYNAIIYEVSK